MASQLDQKIEKLSQVQLSELVKQLVSCSDDAKKQTELFVAGACKLNCVTAHI